MVFHVLAQFSSDDDGEENADNGKGSGKGSGMSKGHGRGKINSSQLIRGVKSEGDKKQKVSDQDETFEIGTESDGTEGGLRLRAFTYVLFQLLNSAYCVIITVFVAVCACLADDANNLVSDDEEDGKVDLLRGKQDRKPNVGLPDMGGGSGVGAYIQPQPQPPLQPVVNDKLLLIRDLLLEGLNYLELPPNPLDDLLQVPTRPSTYHHARITSHIADRI